MFLSWTTAADHEAVPGELVYEYDEGDGNETPRPETGSEGGTVSQPLQDGSDIASALMTSAQAADSQCETASQNIPFSSQDYVLASTLSTPVTSSTTQIVFYLSSTSTTTPSSSAVYACPSTFTFSQTPTSSLPTNMNHYSLVVVAPTASTLSATIASPPSSTVSPLLAATADPNATLPSGETSRATIVGAIVGSILGAALLLCLLFFFLCLKKRRQRHAQADGRSSQPPTIVRQDASPIPETASNSPTLGNLTVHQPYLQPRAHLQQQTHRPQSTSSWPSRISSAILTPIRDSIRPVSSSFTGSGSTPSSAPQSAGSLRGGKATRLFSGVFLVPPVVSESAPAPSPTKEARGLNQEHSAAQRPASLVSNWPLRNSMALRSSYIDRMRSVEHHDHPRNMIAAHQAAFDKTKEGSRASLVYPPPTILAPERVGRGASEYRTSFIAGPEYIVDGTMLAASPADSRPSSRV